MTRTLAQFRSIRSLARPWVRSSLSAMICVLVFASNVGRGGWLGAAAWLMLAMGVLAGLIAVGLFAVRNERVNAPRPTGRV